mgnify:CR=1 FL=1
MIRMRQAVLQALDDALAEDERVVLMGEDIAAAGGAFKVTDGLMAKHGAHRVVDTTISEMAFLGAAVGAAICGMKPVGEMMFIEFVGVALDQLTTEAASMRFLSRGQLTVPLVMRSSAGAGQGFGCQHSQMLDHWFRGTPGLKVVVPSGARTAYGLMRAAIDDPDPVVVLEPRILYGEREDWDVDSSYRVPLGKAEIAREGKDVTLVAVGAMVKVAKEAAQAVDADVEIVDLLTLSPWDRETVVASVRRSGRLITLEESSMGSGFGGDVIAAVAMEGVSLKSAPHRITLPDAPIPYAGNLEGRFVPSPDYVAEQISAVVAGQSPLPWWRKAS